MTTSVDPGSGVVLPSATAPDLEAGVGRLPEAARRAGGFDDNPTPFFNRELSWLAFNQRVLALTADPEVPLLERLRFCAIFSSNLDEFFQVRVAGLDDQIAAGITARTPDGRTPNEQMNELRAVVADLTATQEQVYVDELVPALATEGIHLMGWDALTEGEQQALGEEFERHIFPVLTPLAVDPGHPFPYISDLSLSLAVLVRDPVEGEKHFARLKVPSSLPRFVPLDDSSRFVLLEQVIVAHLDRLFPGMEVVEHHAFRVTRNGDLVIEEEAAEDLLAAVEMELRRRRFGRAVRLEVHPSMSDEVRSLLQRELDLDDPDIYETRAPLDLTSLFAIADLDRPDLQWPSWSPVTEPEVQVHEDEVVDYFAALRRHDILVHHPYSSFSSSVVEFIAQAADDPDVLAIKITLYRISGDSPIIAALIRAAESGKQVAVLIELKARFDEQANIAWAKRLEQAGVHVAYGLVGLKIHTKVCLVVREEAAGLQRYCHVGTGNYNHKTARLYEDMGLLTADREIGEDLTALFNQLTGYGRSVSYHRLLVAPHSLRDPLSRLIANEISAGPEGRITLKMNSLVDPDLIELLGEASRAGVTVELIVRGICCLRPGVPGETDNITVVSVVGRYLEHSRIYRFANGRGPGQPLFVIGSADLMPRNLDRRVEALVPVTVRELRSRLDEVLALLLSDNRLRWDLDQAGEWVRCADSVVDPHEVLQERALRRSGATMIRRSSAPTDSAITVDPSTLGV